MVRRNCRNVREGRTLVRPLLSWTCLLGLALSGAVEGACAGSPQARATSNGGGAGAHIATSARQAKWSYHPAKKGKSTGSLALDEGRLEVDAGGSRWLYLPGNIPVVSAYGAPEPLVGLLKEGERFSFIGESGALYFSRNPLGPLQETRTPSIPLHHTRLHASSLVSLSQSGEIYRSVDRGRSWKLSQNEGFFVDLERAKDDSLLALSVPEQWYRSIDGGEHFSPLTIESIAPLAMSKTHDGRLHVQGLYQSYVFDESSLNFHLRQTRPTPAESEGSLMPEFPKASPIVEGRGVFEGDRYWEVASSAKKNIKRLIYSSNAQEVSSRPLPFLIDCDYPLLAAAGKYVAILCKPQGKHENSPLLSLWRSRDGGETFERNHSVLRGDLHSVVMVAHSQGQLALSGLCSLVTSERGCTPRGLTLFSKTNQRSNVDIPGLSDPSTIRFDNKARLWAAGIRKKDGHPLLVGPWGSSEKKPAIVDLFREAAIPSRGRRRAKNRDSSSRRTRGGAHARSAEFQIFSGSLGLVSLAVKIGQKFYVVVVDEDNQILSSSTAPPGTTKIAGWGSRLLAIMPRQRIVFESLTGGVSWQKSELPREVCSDKSSSCNVGLTCSSFGCLVGDELVRIGWSGGQELNRSSLPMSAKDAREEPLLSPFHCVMKGDNWQYLEGLARLPDVADGALGSAAWRQVLVDEKRAGISSVRGEFGKENIFLKELFPPGPVENTYVFHVSPQIEGVAALRFPYRPTQGKFSLSQSTTRNVEVAWDNRIEGVFGVGKYSIDIPSQKINHSRNRVSISPRLISVAGTGLYLKIGEKPSSGKIYFFSRKNSAQNVEIMPPISWPHQRATPRGWLWKNRATVENSRKEMAQIHGQHSALMMLARQRVIVRNDGGAGSGYSQRARASLGVEPYLMGVLRGGAHLPAQSVRIAYQGKDIGFISLQIDPDTGRGHASFVELGKKGGFETPVPVPLPSDIPSKVRYCTKDDREKTPRVVAPDLLNFRRKVLVELQRGSLSFQTTRAVLFGSPERPCVALWQAKRDDRVKDESVHYHPLIYPDVDAVSWLFRKEKTDSGEERMSVRTMSCSRASPLNNSIK